MSDRAAIRGMRSKLPLGLVTAGMLLLLMLFMRKLIQIGKHKWKKFLTRINDYYKKINAFHFGFDK